MAIRIICILAFLSSSYNCLSQIDSGYVDIKNGVLFYRIWGEGEPLVFLNGGPGFASTGYENYAEEVSKYRKVILFDQRGTGKSKQKRPLRIYISEMVKDLENLRKHLGYEKWDVFGHSFGGEYGQNYIARYPKSINKVILSASPDVTKNNKYSFQEFKETKEENKTELELILDKAYKEGKKIGIHIDTLRKLRNASVARNYVSKPENYSKASLWFLNSARPSSVNISFNTSTKKLLKRLKKFEKPVLIIHGVGDFINIAHPLNLHNVFPNSKLKIIEDSGHIMSLDSPEEYFGTIREFLLE